MSGSLETSDEGVVPMNRPTAAAEDGEGRPETEGNPRQPTIDGTLIPPSMSSGLTRIREAAVRDDPNQRLIVTTGGGSRMR